MKADCCEKRWCSVLIFALYAVAIVTAIWHSTSTRIDIDGLYILGRMLVVTGFLSGYLSLKTDKNHRIVILVILLSMITETTVSFALKTGFNAYHLCFVAVFLVAPAILGFIVDKIPIKPAYTSAVYAASFAISVELVSVSFLNGLTIRYIVDIAAFCFFLCMLLDRYHTEQTIKITALYFAVYALVQVAFGSYVYYLLTLIPCSIIALSVIAIMSAIKAETKKRAAVVVILLLTCSVSYVATPGFYKFLKTTTKEYRLQASAIKECIKARFILDSPDIGQINSDALLGKTAYLYFWSRGCPQCHALMPLFSEMAESSKADTNKVFMAVYLPYKDDDFSQYEETLLQHDYAFRWAAADTSNTIKQDLRFNGVPHLTILDENGVVVYNGYPNKEELQCFERKQHGDKR